MLSLSVVTPSGMVLEQQVDEVTVPGLLGEFGVLPGHIALIAATRPGVLTYRAGGERGRLAVGTGFAEVDGKDHVVVLSQQAARTNKIDRAAAEALLAESDSRLAKQGGGLSAEERAQAESDRQWAQAQLDAVRQ